MKEYDRVVLTVEKEKWRTPGNEWNNMRPKTN